MVGLQQILQRFVSGYVQCFGSWNNNIHGNASYEWSSKTDEHAINLLDSLEVNEKEGVPENPFLISGFWQGVLDRMWRTTRLAVLVGSFSFFIELEVLACVLDSEVTSSAV
jgi:hypothetical protein